MLRRQTLTIQMTMLATWLAGCGDLAPPEAPLEPVQKLAPEAGGDAPALAQQRPGSPVVIPPAGPNLRRPLRPQLRLSRIERPCANGFRHVRHAYSECQPPSWHVVEDAYYTCPDGIRRKYRVADRVTNQTCGEGDPARPLRSLLSRFDGSCVQPFVVDNFITTECIEGFWFHVMHHEYQCIDGSRRITDGMIINPPTGRACEQPMPPPPGGWL